MRKLNLTPEEKKQREYEQHNKWYRNKYHSDEEFRKKVINASIEFNRIKYGRKARLQENF